MKTENTRGDNSLIKLFGELYNQQFPDQDSTEYLAGEEKINMMWEKEAKLGLWVVKMILVNMTISLILVGDRIFNHGQVLPLFFWGLLISIWILPAVVIAIISYINQKKIKSLNQTLGDQGYNFFRDNCKLLESLSDKLGLGILEIQTPGQLAEYFEQRTKSLVHLIKSNQARPDCHSLKTTDSLEDEKALLKKLVEFICGMGLMGTNEISILIFGSPDKRLVDARALWLYKKLFDETKI